ncbi:hypothetical protein Poly21_33380 [Allorhodopirellula heiligendammensis]|uniref:DUF1583 domain-containing protein n=2 Tax=Allorhodopirellula heiligendammensis TaxID=2714739 RepID=A0A5C6BV30_9BACT|nr:hypothetical protein Poly21_33380 [Allorhodopirellula heiligendammensis]
MPECAGNDVIDSLNESREKLPQQWNPDLAGDVNFESLDFNGDPATIERTPAGIRHRKSMTEGVREIRACVSVAGDFDIDVSYRDLAISDGKPTWHCGVGLMVLLDNRDRNRVTLYRRRDRISGKHELALAGQKMNDEGKVIYLGGRQVADSSVAGRLRLARRGTTVTALQSALDGSGERVIGRAAFPLGPVEVQGIRLVAQVGQGLETSVIWSDLHVRAEQIETHILPTEEMGSAELVDQLDQHRRLLTDLTEDVDESTGEGGLTWKLTPHATIAPDDPGFRLLVEASGDVESANILKRCQVNGDLDVQADLHIIHIDPSSKPSSNNDVTLCFYASPHSAGDGVGRLREDQTAELIEATLSLRYKQDGAKELNCRTVGRDHLGKLVYRPIRSVPIDMIDQLRIAVRDRAIYFFYSVTGADDTVVLGRVPIKNEFTITAIGVIQNARGARGRSEVQWKNIQVYGEN